MCRGASCHLHEFSSNPLIRGLWRIDRKPLLKHDFFSEPYPTGARWAVAVFAADLTCACTPLAGCEANAGGAEATVLWYASACLHSVPSRPTHPRVYDGKAMRQRACRGYLGVMRARDLGGKAFVIDFQLGIKTNHKLLSSLFCVHVLRVFFLSMCNAFAL